MLALICRFFLANRHSKSDVVIVSITQIFSSSHKDYTHMTVQHQIKLKPKRTEKMTPNERNTDSFNIIWTLLIEPFQTWPRGYKT